MTTRARPNAFAFVLVTVLIDMMGFGLIMPVMPTLLAELTGLPLEQAAPWGGYLAAVYAVLNFLCGPLLGNLSDRFGRRPVLLLSMAALGANFLIMGLAETIWVLFIGRVLSGVAGATHATATAYIADVTEPDQRGRAFGLIGAAFGLGFILGPVLGGLLGQIDARAPFYAAAALSALNVAYGIFVLPESLPPESRRSFDLGRANPLGAFRHFSKLPHVAYFIVALGLLQFAQMLFPVVWAFYVELKFGWSASQVGASLGLVGLCHAIIQAGVLGLVLKRLGPERTAKLAIGIGVVGLVAYAFADRGALIYVIIPLSSMMAMAGPAIQSLGSNRVAKNAQGELQGAIASGNALATMLSPLVMTQAFAYFSSGAGRVRFPGAPFLLAALAMLAATIPLVLGIRAPVPAEERPSS